MGNRWSFLIIDEYNYFVASMVANMYILHA